MIPVECVLDEKLTWRRVVGGYCSLSGVLLRKIIQNWVSMSRFARLSSHSLIGVIIFFCTSKRPQTWECVDRCAVSQAIAIWSVVRMSACFFWEIIQLFN